MIIYPPNTLFLKLLPYSRLSSGLQGFGGRGPEGSVQDGFIEVGWFRLRGLFRVFQGSSGLCAGLVFFKVLGCTVLNCRMV